MDLQDNEHSAPYFAAYGITRRQGIMGVGVWLILMVSRSLWVEESWLIATTLTFLWTGFLFGLSMIFDVRRVSLVYDIWSPGPVALLCLVFVGIGGGLMLICGSTILAMTAYMIIHGIWW